MPAPLGPYAAVTQMSEAEPEWDRQFLVYIVESPSHVDLYHKRYEGEALAKALALADIRSEHKLVVNEEALRAAFVVGLKEVLGENSEYLPIVHVSAHGGADGIELTDGTQVSWALLREILSPINIALEGSLVLCMSACRGFNACRMAMQAGELPFLAVIGNSGDPTWSDTTVGYAAFYHLIKKGQSFAAAVDGMRAASGDPNFIIVSGADAQRVYLDDLQKLEPSRVEAAVEAEVERSGPSSLQKALEHKK